MFTEEQLAVIVAAEKQLQANAEECRRRHCINGIANGDSPQKEAVIHDYLRDGPVRERILKRMEAAAEFQNCGTH